MICLCDCGICKCEHGFSRTVGKAKQLAKHVGESALLNDANAVVLKSFLIAAALHLNKTFKKYIYFKWSLTALGDTLQGCADPYKEGTDVFFLMESIQRWRVSR